LHFYAQDGLNCNPPSYASHIAGMISRYHWTQLFIGWDGI
jgi:hypothetical protein